MQSKSTSFSFYPFSSSTERLFFIFNRQSGSLWYVIFNGIENEVEEASSNIFMDAALWLHCDERAVLLLMCIYISSISFP